MVPSSNQTWQWKIHPIYRWFSQRTKPPWLVFLGPKKIRAPTSCWWNFWNFEIPVHGLTIELEMSKQSNHVWDQRCLALSELRTDFDTCLDLRYKIWYVDILYYDIYIYNIIYVYICVYTHIYPYHIYWRSTLGTWSWRPRTATWRLLESAVPEEEKPLERRPVLLEPSGRLQAVLNQKEICVILMSSYHHLYIYISIYI